MNPDSSFPSIYELKSIVERLEPARLFPRAQPLEVEIGSGDGSFLTQYAGARPDRNFIGVERLIGRLHKLDRKITRLRLENIRTMRIEAAYFLEYLLPAHSVEAIHIYFPDPWPKRKHHRNRLINTYFPELARKALVDGGVVYLRTDDEDYFTQMKAVFAANPCFQVIPVPESLAAIQTDFERRFVAQGIATRAAAYRLITH